MTAKQFIIEKLESLLRWGYSWLSDNDEILGKILYTLHILTLLVILVMIFISHTIYPVFWLQSLVFIVVLIIWIQHILLRSCVCSSLERKLMGDDAPLAIDVVLSILGIPVSKQSRMGVTLLMSSVGVAFLGLELIARCVMYWRERAGVSPWL